MKQKQLKSKAAAILSVILFVVSAVPFFCGIVTFAEEYVPAEEKYYTDENGINYTFDNYHNEAIVTSSFSFSSVVKSFDSENSDDYVHAFGEFYPKRDVVIPAEVKGRKVVMIAAGAFMLDAGLTSITLPSTLEQIKVYAFAGCDNLSSVIIEDDGNRRSFKVCSSAFANCQSLTEIIMPNCRTITGIYSFGGCKNLQKIVFPFDDVYTELSYSSLIEENSFKSCENLTIYSLSGGYAESFALENGINFVAIDEEQTSQTPEVTLPALVQLNKYLLGNAPVPADMTVLYDFNKDGKINAVDLIIAKRKFLAQF